MWKQPWILNFQIQKNMRSNITISTQILIILNKKPIWIKNIPPKTRLDLLPSKDQTPTIKTRLEVTILKEKELGRKKRLSKGGGGEWGEMERGKRKAEEKAYHYTSKVKNETQGVLHVLVFV